MHNRVLVSEGFGAIKILNADDFTLIQGIQINVHISQFKQLHKSNEIGLLTMKGLHLVDYKDNPTP